jgi:hypothetical protein
LSPLASPIIDLGRDELLALTAEADPVLAKLWDNPRDAAYDRR